MRNPEVIHDWNQSPVFEDVNLFTSDAALKEAVIREGAGGFLDELDRIGARTGSAAALDLARLANSYPPQLRIWGPKGDRIDRVEYHPAYHALMRESIEAGLHCRLWEFDRTGSARAPGTYVARAAAFYMTAQLEAGHCCPITMTSAAVPTLMIGPAPSWVQGITTRSYQPELAVPSTKRGLTIGMGMTERQGGTDVRTNVTRAEAIGGPGSGEYRITGQKWFLSAPMSDAFLVLAQAAAGLSCFLLPRILPDGTPNGIHLQRLKDKLGNRSNASAEVEFQSAHAWRIGAEGRGIPTIIEMVSETRLDCAVASAGLMRAALSEAVHHCRSRRVFGKRLIDQPLMLQVLADMALDVEAATALILHLARACDHAANDPLAGEWRRLMIPVAKYWVCKLASPLIGEAMECVGGNGYVEESRLPRLYREAPVNSIWEGSGNVMALDVLRVLNREPQAIASVLAGIAQSAGEDARIKAALQRLDEMLREPTLLEARALVEGLALVAAASILRAHAPQAVADAFIETRLGGTVRQTYGHGLRRANTHAIVARVLPV